MNTFAVQKEPCLAFADPGHARLATGRSKVTEGAVAATSLSCKSQIYFAAVALPSTGRIIKEIAHHGFI